MILDHDMRTLSVFVNEVDSLLLELTLTPLFMFLMTAASLGLNLLSLIKSPFWTKLSDFSFSRQPAIQYMHGTTGNLELKYK